MECHDVRLLLTFSERRCEQIDAAERNAVAQHLNGCHDCAAFAAAERAVDESLGQLMRDDMPGLERSRGIIPELGLGSKNLCRFSVSSHSGDQPRCETAAADRRDHDIKILRRQLIAK